MALPRPAPIASNAAAPAEAKHLSIVVLPFANLSGDPAQDYFVDGVLRRPGSSPLHLRRPLSPSSPLGP